jgi:hypothetical protein
MTSIHSTVQTYDELLIVEMTLREGRHGMSRQSGLTIIICNHLLTDNNKAS